MSFAVVIDILIIQNVLVVVAQRVSFVLRKGAYFKDDRIFFGLFWPPPPFWTQNDVIVTLNYDVIVTNTDRIWPTPLPPRLRSSLKYPPKRDTKCAEQKV